MASLLCPAVRRDRNPQLRPGLDALDGWLADHHYSRHAREAIRRHVATSGTLAGTRYIEPEDEAAAEAAFVDALPAVPFDNAAWSRPDAFLDVEMLAAGTHPEPFGDGPDAPDDPRYYGPTRVWMLNPPRISGGAPDEEPYPLPDAAALAEYDQWSRGLDDCGDFPRVKTADDRRADVAEELAWWRTHPEA